MSVIPVLTSHLIQQSRTPSEVVIRLWTDGLFQVVDYEIKHIVWISMNINISNIKHMMPKIGICATLPFPLILGFDWQQLQARCTCAPNGSLCIFSPSSLHLYECIHKAKRSINCLINNELSLPPLDDVVLLETSVSLQLKKQLVLKSEKLSAKQPT
ncbi:uncharacterized protein NPIL_534221 [Nephila pilipes]|uniref:Uncharacterized protein n=1 Tax=Nephila pilipes TaxID=299642 RepID=A0A8X6TWP9_NEPPI|nr:uncharacterized protein NPIL_534221 [Nephila pilipes]